MSTKISQVFQDYFDAEVKAAYGADSGLQSTVYTKTGVVGNKAYFRKAGKGTATAHTSGQDRAFMNPEFTQVPCNLSGWDAFDYADNLDETYTNVNEIKELADIAGVALRCKKDDLVINAMNLGFNATKNLVDSSANALKVANLLEAKKKLDDVGVDNMDRTFIHDASQLQALLGTTEVTSTDYNSVKALVNGEVNTFLGCKFILIPTRANGGLPLAGGVRTSFMYHKRAVGLALGKDIKTEMYYDGRRGGYIVGGSFSAGAVVIDDEGVVAIKTKA